MLHVARRRRRTHSGRRAHKRGRLWRGMRSARRSRSAHHHWRMGGPRVRANHHSSGAGRVDHLPRRCGRGWQLRLAHETLNSALFSSILDSVLCVLAQFAFHLIDRLCNCLKSLRNLLQLNRLHFAEILIILLKLARLYI